MTPEPPLRLHLDSEALVANWQRLDALSGKARAGAAVKADAYGLGARRVAKVLADAGCRDFFVAYAGEAAELDGVIDPAAIRVLHGPLSDDDTAYMKQAGLRPTINSLAQAARWLKAVGGACDLMVDTGINRLGLPMEDLGNELVGRLNVCTMMSHLASADEDSPLNAQQCARWTEARAAVQARDYSLANSAGIVLGAEYHGTLTRPGLALYGGVPRAELTGEVASVAKPAAMIMQVRDLSAGDTVGYNATFTAPRPMRVGVVALGYADGFLRCWSGKGMLRSNGCELPVLGRVSMDMTVIDLSAAPTLSEGDWVEMDYDLPQASHVSGLSQYELLTLLGRRFSR
ncbi:alanine racemase [Novosphingobium aquae]|uniref:alanine racemase n=1 Tax=Novosphingobium aquae TaxID=3133435 RepID=A0ABU8S6H2_9SPHN